MKKNMVIAGLVLMFLACSRIESESDAPMQQELTFTAYREGFDADTKTERGEVNEAGFAPVYWLPGDAVSLFFDSGNKGGNKFVAQNQSKAEIAEFKGTIDSFAGGGEGTSSGYYFWAVYPYSEDVSCDGETVTLSLSAAQTGKVGSFESGLFPTIAKAKGLELGFYNIARGIKFTVAGKDKNGTERNIRAVKFRGNSNESLAGKVKVGWDAQGYPEVRETLQEVQEVCVTAPSGGTFIPDAEYFIVFLPGVFESGFSLTFITDDGKQGTYNYPKSFTFDRGWFGRLPGLDGRIADWTEAEGEIPGNTELEEGGTESGLYLGISTFDYVLQYNPVHLISEESLDGYNKIVDDMQLATEPNTLLYYSIDEDITSMKEVQLPSDLFYVALVTFTDGLDQGSMSKRRGLYMDDLEFLEDIHHRLKEEQVSGQYIKSYAIGLRGDDARSNPELFDKNLELIASEPQSSSEQYVYKVDNMSGVNSAFESIASQLTQNFKVQRLSLRIPFPSGHGAKIRFTLDNKTADASSKYIEGTFDITSYSLTNVQYVGISSSSGCEVAFTEDDGDNFTYVFEDIPVINGAEITADNIRHWHRRASESSWTENSEFKKKENAKTFTEFKSAMVMLNLDLSMSLEGQLPTLQQSVKSFISRLYANSVDPDVVKAIRLNKTEMTLLAGASETLVANVSPSTASTTSLRWESAIPSVATVDNTGKVTGVSEGTTIVSVRTDDGNTLASCTVHVTFIPVESVSLNKTSLNLYEGKSEKLIATISPSTASNPTVKWTSSAPSVATVNDGVVEGISKGTATITVTTVDGEKTASCEVTVGEYAPSADPIDLSLAVYSPKNERRGFITNEEISSGVADLNEYVVEGLTVLSNSGNFIIALQNSENTYRKYFDLYYCLPTYAQGITISARWSEINAALQKYGGTMFTSSYYATSAVYSGTTYYAIRYSGGSLSTVAADGHDYIREVIPIETPSPHVFLSKGKGVYLTYQKGGKRYFETDQAAIPAGSKIEGLAVQSPKGYGNVIIELNNAASSQSMTYTAAAEVYGIDDLMTDKQAQLISLRWGTVNSALSKYGGTQLNSNYYYWTKSSASSSAQFVIYYYSNKYGSLGTMSSAGTALLRYTVGTFDNSELPLPLGL